MAKGYGSYGSGSARLPTKGHSCVKFIFEEFRSCSAALYCMIRAGAHLGESFQADGLLHRQGGGSVPGRGKH
jgi:hypothetical protein